MEKYHGIKKSGIFQIDNKHLQGELSLNGKKSKLEVYSREFFDADNIVEKSILGEFHDRQKISLIGCTTAGTGSGRRQDDHYAFSEFIPHYVVFGDSHITAEQKIITEVSFEMDDSSTLFYDFDAFGRVINPDPFINEIARANSNLNGRIVQIGSYPEILYFSGKNDIFETDTRIGLVASFHLPISSASLTKGLRFDNKIITNIKTRQPLSINDAVNNVLILLRFFEVLVGRPQTVLNLTVKTENDIEQPHSAMEVYWCHAPKRNELYDSIDPMPNDILLDCIDNSEEFSTVLRNWIEKESDRSTARIRFSQCFGNQSNYPFDRLIGAANTFDILPKSACPEGTSLSLELEEARQQCKAIMKKLPQSISRDRVLGELGRITKKNLKQKIRYRAEIIVEAVGDVFPELNLVIDEAVNCRNYFVHGGNARIDYYKNIKTFFFLTDTLEFIFAAADLIEAGWDIKSWVIRGTSLSHPFGAYKIEYSQHVRILKGLLSEKKEA